MVSVRARGKKWLCDIRFRWPDGERFRERITAPVASKVAATRWAQQRETTLLLAGREAYEPTKAAQAPTEVPTLDAFWPRVVTGHYEANRKKASTVAAAKQIYRTHLGPALGAKRLDAITTAHVVGIKAALKDASPKTVNNVLSVLSRALRCAVDWDVIKAIPCKFGLLKVADGERDWYELPEYRRLTDAARLCGHRKLLLVLLAGSAGLRRGEIIALRWTDLDLQRRQIRIGRAVWATVEDTPKSGHGRTVPMTDELHAALQAHRHLAGERVLYSDPQGPNRAPRELSNRTIRNWLAQAQRRAGLVANGGIHILRHTFCSHLAAAGAPAKAIQELAGHSDLKTTQRYMHLSPGNRSEAMGALTRFYAAGNAAGAGAQPGISPVDVPRAS